METMLLWGIAFSIFFINHQAEKEGRRNKSLAEKAFQRNDFIQNDFKEAA